MSTLVHWAAMPWTNTLAWALAHSLWQGALIAFVLGIALLLSRPASARLRYVLACAALAGMLLSFAATLVLLRPASDTVPEMRAHGLSSQISFVGALTLPVQSDAQKGAVLPWIVPVWMAGVLLFYARTAGGWLAAQRLCRCAASPAPEAWQERLRELCRGLRVKPPVLLLESWMTEVPVVIGFLRPVILVPAGLLSGLPPDQLEAILIHELEHIRRYDYFVNVLQGIVEGLFFYHPAVWWVSRIVRAEREHCCDDRAVAIVGDAWAYAAALATLEQSRSAGGVLLAATGGNLLHRIRRLVAPRRRGSARRSLLAAVLVLLSGTVAVLFWSGPGAGAALLAQNPPQPSPRISGAFQKWLEEDVAYIISDAERGEFVLLKTAQEREQFIERFWQKRDPTPGGPKNQFKEEHYRRIAYANHHYAALGPGWKSDRGRIYIQYGPPDEIESHPSGESYRRPPEQGGGTTSTYPYEQWLYRQIAGIGSSVMFEFVDASGKGEYRLIPAPSPSLPGIPAPADSPFRIEVSPRSAAAPATAVISITERLLGPATDIFGVVTNQDRRVVQMFHDPRPAGGPYQKRLQLAQGSYRVEIALRDPSTRQSQRSAQTVTVP